MADSSKSSTSSDNTAKDNKKRLTKQRMRFILIAVLAVLLLLFASYNTNPVAITLPFTQVEVGLFWALFASAFLGAAVVLLNMLPTRLRNNKLIATQTERISKLEKLYEASLVKNEMYEKSLTEQSGAATSTRAENVA